MTKNYICSGGDTMEKLGSPLGHTEYRERKGKTGRTADENSVDHVLAVLEDVLYAEGAPCERKASERSRHRRHTPSRRKALNRYNNH